MKKYTYPIFTVFLAVCACTSIRLQLPEKKSSATWLGAGGGPAQHNYRKTGPRPPLELIETLSFTGAPVQNMVAIDSTVLVGTMNGYIHSYRLQEGKGKGKIKLPNNIVGNMSLHPSGLLFVGLEIGRETLHCYDLRTGDLKWKQRAGLLAGEPVVADSSVYLVARFKHVDRYEASTGKRVWRYDFKSHAHTAPGLSDDSIIFGTDSGTIYALQKETGTKIWQQQANAAIFASPLVDTDRVYIGATDSTVRALDLETGASLWTFKAEARIRRTPALAENMLITAAGDGVIYSIDSATGRVLWQYKCPSGIGTSPLIVDKIIYFGALDKHLYALKLHSGELSWGTELRGRVRTNPIAIGEYLVVGSEDKYVYVFKEAQDTITN